MISYSFKQLSIFSALGLSVLVLMGFMAGLQMNPITQSLENEDLKRDLSNTQEELTEKNEEVDAKKILVDDFIKEYRKLGK